MSDSPVSFSKLRESDAGVEDAYQLDAVVSLFAIVLLILVTTSLSLSVGNTWFAYRTLDDEKGSMQLKSLGVPFRRQETWVVQNDYLLRINYDVIAQIVFSQSGGMTRYAEDNITETLLTFESGGGPPGSYQRMEVILSGKLVENVGGIVSEIISLNDEEALYEWATKPSPVNLIVWSSGVDKLPRILDEAFTSGRPLSLSFQSGGGKYYSRKTPESFDFKRILRAF